jgi:phytoene dehydrogenase-like protein
VKKDPVLIIGAGIGGLSTAAYLSRKGISSIILEQSSHVGGRCCTREIAGYSHEIGALYLGGAVFRNLREIYGVECKTVPVRCGVKVNNEIVDVKWGIRSLWRIHKCGIGWRDIIAFACRYTKAIKRDDFSESDSMGDVFDSLTHNDTLKKVLLAAAGQSGISPYQLPARNLSPRHPIAQYRLLEPEYIRGGNGELAKILSEVAMQNCSIKFNQKVKKILIINGFTAAVQTDCDEYKARIVVSNAGLKKTVQNMTDQDVWPEYYYKRVFMTGETLKVVNIFMTIDRRYAFPGGYSIYILPYDICREFELLERGQYPEKSMFILHVPSVIDDLSKDVHRATLQFYLPRAEFIAKDCERQANKILKEGLEDLLPGLSNAIKNYTIYDPFRYEQEFGFCPRVFGVPPDMGHSRFDIQTPINGLFLVGDSVAPEGPSVPQAMASGIDCARVIERLYQQ